MHERPKGFARNRFLALLIDLLVVAFLCQLLFILIGTPDWGRYLAMQDDVKGLDASDPIVLERVELYEKCFITTLGVLIVYEALFMIILGATPGKLIFRLRVVSNKAGRNMYSVKLRLLIRSLVKALSIYLLSAIPFVFMCLTFFGNAEGRSGFDVFVGTKVIDIRERI